MEEEEEEEDEEKRYLGYQHPLQSPDFLLVSCISRKIHYLLVGTQVCD